MLGTLHIWLLAGIYYMSSQQELNHIRRIVTNLGGELTSQAESYQLLMEKCKQLEKSNQLLTQINHQLS